MKQLDFVRQTLKEPVSFEGRGVHSGCSVNVKVGPADSGIVFRYKGQEWQASPANVTRTQLCTCLGEISTIEHLMSAFAALEVTDALVEVSAPELPAMDGASFKFCLELISAGFEQLGTGSLSFPDGTILGQDGNMSIEIKPGTGKIQYVFESGERWPNSQSYNFQFDSTKRYLNEIAPARTFCFEEQVAQILAAGLGQGLDETTALIIGEHGYVNQEKFPDEPARHKILDLMGDLYLGGVPLRFLDIIGCRGGHALNVQAAGKLAESVRISVSTA